VSDRARVEPAAPPGAEHYGRKYFSKRFARIASYRMQALLTVEAVKGMQGGGAPRALLIGKGDGIVEAILARCGVEVTTLDIQPELEPDIVASVEQIPVEAGSFDVAVCCQVLEHLPFEKFRGCLAELRRVCGTSGGLVLSLPDQRPYLSLGFALTNTQRNISLSLPCLPPRRISAGRREKMGHHWEIGFAETPMSVVKREIAASGWRLQRTLRVRDLPWHTFFVGR
jgi:SAM-dependent methyltransferase